MVREYVIVRRVITVQGSVFAEIFMAVWSGDNLKRIEDLRNYQLTGGGVSPYEEEVIAGDKITEIKHSGVNVKVSIH